ncbi:zinc finger protein 85-like [Pundamilia nyererei]|uniref:Zinc finger protein 85-like n=1 Tax=Pundamilia nyererei TaxID=303518 RepID=A0A9Y3RWJ6_9CICH|nr:PREDICTED: zinc finger protein 85-like [Pundamilia nyererei]
MAYLQMGQTDPGGECSQEAEDARPTTSGDESHTCDQCERTFATKSRLTVHKRIHADVKLYRCDECGTSFCRSSSLKRHRVIHSGLRPYTCEQCGKTFNQMSILERHRLLHSGIKPHLQTEADACSAVVATVLYRLLHSGPQLTY